MTIEIVLRQPSEEGQQLQSVYTVQYQSYGHWACRRRLLIKLVTILTSKGKADGAIANILGSV